MSIESRNSALSFVEVTNDETWVTNVVEAICYLAEQTPVFTVDDVWDSNVGPPPSGSKSRIGPVFEIVRRAGIIRKSGIKVMTNSGHHEDTNVWLSNVYTGDSSGWHVVESVPMKEHFTPQSLASLLDSSALRCVVQDLSVRQMIDLIGRLKIEVSDDQVWDALREMGVDAQ